MAFVTESEAIVVSLESRGRLPLRQSALDILLESDDSNEGEKYTVFGAHFYEDAKATDGVKYILENLPTLKRIDVQRFHGSDV